MEYPVIAKPAVDQMRVRPNLVDVEAAREGFRWESVYEELDWLPGGHLNKAHECIDRHCQSRPGGQGRPHLGGQERRGGELHLRRVPG